MWVESSIGLRFLTFLGVGNADIALDHCALSYRDGPRVQATADACGFSDLHALSGRNITFYRSGKNDVRRSYLSLPVAAFGDRYRAIDVAVTLDLAKEYIGSVSRQVADDTGSGRDKGHRAAV